jgi:hypothetical protein
LEDLTGIHCQFCPDGAKVADNLKAGAPDRFVLIGNHAGGYAAPGSYPYDLRTTEGTTIDNLSDPAGYPAGNINRIISSNASKPGKTAIYRNYWASESSTIMSEPSPVNLGVEAYYNPGSMTLTINVEAYYTSNGNGMDYLTVAILQDNIDTYQSGAATWYPARIQPSGLYRQMDVLRAYVTSPVTGEEIATTTSTSFFAKTYTYNAVQVGPDIAPVIADMKVAVWMAEDLTFSEVITAVVTDAESRPVGINEAASLENLNIYPNPFATEATLEFDLDAAQMLTINLFDVTGKTVQNIPSQLYSVGNHKIAIEGNGLENGLYYVNIIAKDGIVTRRLVLNR